MRAPRLKVMCHSIGNRALLAMLLLLLAGCTSRYRLNLYLIQGETRSKVKVEKTEFITEAVLGDPMARDKLIPGDGNCLILITGSRGRTLDTEAQDLISYDRYTRYRVFLQLPPTVKAGSISLPDNSFVQMLGRYEVAAEDKMYFPADGTLVVDSLSGKKLFGTLDGRFENRRGETIAFSGKFKIKVSR